MDDFIVTVIDGTNVSYYLVTAKGYRAIGPSIANDLGQPEGTPPANGVLPWRTWTADTWSAYIGTRNLAAS